MDLLERIARSLAEELQPPTGTTILYVESARWTKIPERFVIMYPNNKKWQFSGTLVSISINQSNVHVTGPYERCLDYNDPELLDRLQKILDEAANRPLRIKPCRRMD